MTNGSRPTGRARQAPSGPADALWDRRTAWLRRWLAAFWLALLAATWRLWTPQEVFPQVPFVGALREAPGWVDWAGLVGLAAGLIGTLAVRSRARLQAFTSLTAASLFLLALLDQHRFQPWAYQLSAAALVLAFAPAGQAAMLLRVLTVSLYFWSAVSKFDYTFLHGIGPDMLRGLLEAVGIPRPGGDTATALAWAFPAGELAVAILLAIRRTRPLGLAIAVTMHVLLLLALGPFGLNHEPGVLLWNTYFIGQDLLLFRRPADGWSGSAGPTGRVRWRDLAHGFLPLPRPIGVARLVTFAAVWLPALEPFGWLDHWPAWAVYAPGAERVTLLLGEGDADRLPEPLHRHLGPVQPDGYRVLRTDLWSLDALGAPIYPQGRFRTGVALAVARRYELDDARLVAEGRADRRTGKRSRAEYVGERAIRAYAEMFRLNALPRRPWDR